MPSFVPMTITQNTHAPSTPANETTPSVDVATPTNPDRGRITRIATIEETTDPVFDPAATTEIANAEPKDFYVVSTPKIESFLHRTNLERSFIASGPQDNTYLSLGSVIARQNNYASIAGNTAGGSPSLHNPVGISGKPQTQGSPSMAHNDPDTGGGSPSFAGVQSPTAPTPNSQTTTQETTVNPEIQETKTSLAIMAAATSTARATTIPAQTSSIVIDQRLIS